MRNPAVPSAWTSRTCVSVMGRSEFLGSSLFFSAGNLTRSESLELGVQPTSVHLRRNAAGGVVSSHQAGFTEVRSRFVPCGASSGSARKRCTGVMLGFAATPCANGHVVRKLAFMGRPRPIRMSAASTADVMDHCGKLGLHIGLVTCLVHDRNVDERRS